MGPAGRSVKRASFLGRVMIDLFVGNNDVMASRGDVWAVEAGRPSPGKRDGDVPRGPSSVSLVPRNTFPLLCFAFLLDGPRSGPLQVLQDCKSLPSAACSIHPFWFRCSCTACRRLREQIRTSSEPVRNLVD